MANIEEHYKHVFVHHYRTEDELVEVNPKYVYMMIPTEYVCVYHKLLVYLADFGKALLSDCSAACRGNSKTIVDCWNMFQSALACKALGRDKEAQLYIDYIKAQLKLVYKGTGKEVYDDAFIAPLDRFGHLHGIVSCGDVVKFMVDPETGELLEKTTEDADHVFVRDDEVIPPVEEFTLSGTVNPAEAATINYLGKYTKGTKVAVSFTIAEGYELERVVTDIDKSDIKGDWLTDAHVIVTMNKNNEIIANFKKKVEPEPKPELERDIYIRKVDKRNLNAPIGLLFINNGDEWKDFINYHINSTAKDISVTVKFVEQEGYKFKGWYIYIDEYVPDNVTINDLVAISFNKEYTYIMPSDIIKVSLMAVMEKEAEPVFKTFTAYQAMQSNIHIPFENIYVKRDGTYVSTGQWNEQYKEDTITKELKVLDNIERYEFDGWYSYGNGNPIPDDLNYDDLFLESIDKEFKFTTSPYSKNGVVLIAILKKKVIKYQDYYIHCTKNNGPLTSVYNHFLFKSDKEDTYGGQILEVRTNGTDNPSRGQEDSEVYVKGVSDNGADVFLGWYKHPNITSNTTLNECTMISDKEEATIPLAEITDPLKNTRIDVVGVYEPKTVPSTDFKFAIGIRKDTSSNAGSGGTIMVKRSDQDYYTYTSLTVDTVQFSKVKSITAKISRIENGYEFVTWKRMYTTNNAYEPNIHEMTDIPSVGDDHEITITRSGIYHAIVRLKQ